MVIHKHSSYIFETFPTDIHTYMSNLNKYSLNIVKND